MQYTKTVRALFQSRPNRFVAHVLIDGKAETVHVKNTGRCKELLRPGCTVILARSDTPGRKTKYDLIAVYKDRENRPPLLVNMDSMVPNDAAAEWLPKSGLFSPGAKIRREVTRGASRFDFCIEDGGKTTFLEVKGVTLEENGIASFPDAPTERGVRHIRELIRLKEEGYGAAVLFVIQMEQMKVFRPNDTTHPAFGDALRDAKKAGVAVLAMQCAVAENSMEITAPVKVELE